MADQAKYIILAVKPQYFDPVLKNIRNVVTEANVIISIAPGITIGQLKEKLGIEKRVVRAMPNTVGASRQRDDRRLLRCGSL